MTITHLLVEQIVNGFVYDRTDETTLLVFSQIKRVYIDHADRADDVDHETL
jgi:hypothetical protein